MSNRKNAWSDAVITGPVSVYQALAWTYQTREYPELFCEGMGFTEEQLFFLTELIDNMLAVALLAAGADEDWEKLYSKALARFSQENQRGHRERKN